MKTLVRVHQCILMIISHPINSDENNEFELVQKKQKKNKQKKNKNKNRMNTL